jgi:hypothetical protein
MELEQYLIVPDSWDKILHHIPNELHEEIRNDGRGYSIGVGYREDTGWFVLACGQGPCIIWMERDYY